MGWLSDRLRQSKASKRKWGQTFDDMESTSKEYLLGKWRKLRSGVASYDWQDWTDKHGQEWQYKPHESGMQVRQKGDVRFWKPHYMQTGATYDKGVMPHTWNIVGWGQLDRMGGRGQDTQVQRYIDEVGDKMIARKKKKIYGGYTDPSLDFTGLSDYEKLERLIKKAKAGTDLRDIYDLGIFAQKELGVGVSEDKTQELESFAQKWKDSPGAFFLDPLSHAEEDTLKSMQQEELAYKGGDIGETIKTKGESLAGGIGGVSPELDISSLTDTDYQYKKHSTEAREDYLQSKAKSFLEAILDDTGYGGMG